jgi:hypothetical protein
MVMRKKAILLCMITIEMLSLGAAFWLYYISGTWSPGLPRSLREVVFCVMIYFSGYIVGQIHSWYQRS